MTVATLPQRHQPTGSRRAEITRMIRAQANRAQADHPALSAHAHMRDAARSLDAGSTEGAQRHLRAAMHQYEPVSLYRHGIQTDEEHTAARQHLAGVHRALLQVSEVQDTEDRNNQLREARQEAAGNPAMNAPNRTSAGPSDGAARGPAAPSPGGNVRQYSNTVDLVGPKGYVHGWRYVGAAAQPVGSHGWQMRGQPGDMLHIRSISDLGDKLAPFSPITANALHNVARSVAMRDMKGARLHMASARYGNQAELRNEWTAEMDAIDHSLTQVPRGVQPLPRPPAQNLQRLIDSGAIPSNLLNPRLSAARIALELSARTAMLERTPAPYGKPGGPGLYGVAGNKHSDYFEQVVQALMTKRGMDKGKASRIAWGALRKWRSGRGHVHPEVRAAATGALAEEDVARARAHANTVAAAVELGGPGSGNPNQARVAGGHPGGGQWTASGGGQAKAGKGGHSGHARPAQHATAHGQSARSAAKARLLGEARGLRKQAAALTVKINALWAQYHAASRSSGSTSGLTGAAAAAAAKAATAASTATSTPAKVSGTAAGAAATAAAASRATAGILRQINGLKAQRHALLVKAAALVAQARRL